MNSLYEKKIAKALNYLYKENPGYYFIIRNMQITVKKDFPYPAAVFKKNSSIQIILSENSLINGSFIDIVGLLEHELSHALLQHLRVYPKKFNKVKLNQAMDYIINDSCPSIRNRYEEIENSNSILKGGCFANKIKELPSLIGKSIQDMSHIDLYHILDKEAPDELTNSSNTLDDHELMEGGESIDKNDVNQLIKDCATGLKEEMKNSTGDGPSSDSLDKSIGKLPSSIQKELEKMLSHKGNFKENLMYFYNIIKNSTYKKTFHKINRRYPYEAKGKHNLKKPNILLGIDTSGSMCNPEILELIAYEVKMYSKICENLWVICGDTKLQSSHKIKHGKFNLRDIKFTGGGGTDLQFIWDFAKEHKIDGAIIHTDGYIPEFLTYKVRSLFAIYPGGRKVPNFKNVFINGEDI
jgi:predicted metal-dependent peptidase